MSGSTKLQVGVLRLLAGGGSNKRKNQDLIEEYFQEILGFSNSGKEGNLSGGTMKRRSTTVMCRMEATFMNLNGAAGAHNIIFYSK